MSSDKNYLLQGEKIKNIVKFVSAYIFHLKSYNFDHLLFFHPSTLTLYPSSFIFFFMLLCNFMSYCLCSFFPCLFWLIFFLWTLRGHEKFSLQKNKKSLRPGTCLQCLYLVCKEELNFMLVKGLVN